KTGVPLPTATSDDLAVYLLGTLDTPRRVDQGSVWQQARGFHSFRHKDDRILFRTMPLSPSSIFPDNASFAAPNTGDRLFIIGINGYLPEGSWRDAIAWTDTQSCSVIKMSDRGCILHMCQTTPGFSGGAVFRTNDPQALSIVGMHISAAAADEGCGV